MLSSIGHCINAAGAWPAPVAVWFCQDHASQLVCTHMQHVLTGTCETQLHVQPRCAQHQVLAYDPATPAHPSHHHATPYYHTHHLPAHPPNPRHLHVPLFNAERAWSYAMELKGQAEQQGAAGSSGAAGGVNLQKRNHLKRRLAKVAACMHACGEGAGGAAEVTACMHAGRGLSAVVAFRRRAKPVLSPPRAAPTASLPPEHLPPRALPSLEHPPPSASAARTLL